MPNPKELTEFDALVSDNHLQMMKAAIPYIPISQQQALSVYIKFLELANTFKLVQKKETQTLGICSVSEQKKNTTEMLNAIKQYCTDAEREMIDLLMNFFSAFHIYHSYQEFMPKDGTNNSGEQTSGNPVDMLKNMLSPEQKSMLDTYSTILSSVK